MNPAQLESKHLTGLSVLNILGGLRQGKLNNCSLETQQVSTDERKKPPFLSRAHMPMQKKCWSAFLGEINQLHRRRRLFRSGTHLSPGCLATFFLFIIFSMQLIARCVRYGQKNDVLACECMQCGFLMEGNSREVPR